jgi:hypothetical protein
LRPGVVIGICAVGWSRPAAAYRPFDGTDAAVADVGEVEIEFQPLGAAHAGGTTKGLTDVIVNYGFADRWDQRNSRRRVTASFFAAVRR